jgi:peroxin-1
MLAVFYPILGIILIYYTVSVVPSTNSKALLVTSGTELSIAPKTRTKVNGISANGLTSTSKSSGQLNGQLDMKEHEATEIEKKRPARILRTLPSRIMPTFNPSCSSLEDGSVAAVGFVSNRLLNTLSELPPDAEPKNWLATVRRIAGPQDPTQEPGAAAPAAPAVPRILLPTDPNKPKAEATSDREILPNQILVSWTSELEIPDGHIVVYGSVAELVDWDQARYVVCDPWVRIINRFIYP